MSFKRSTMGHHITPHFSLKIYNASKIALTVLCDGLRHELQLVGSKIKVSVCYLLFVCLFCFIYNSLFL